MKTKVIFKTAPDGSKTPFTIACDADAVVRSGNTLAVFALGGIYTAKLPEEQLNICMNDVALGSTIRIDHVLAIPYDTIGYYPTREEDVASHELYCAIQNSIIMSQSLGRSLSNR